jgi:predicted transposase YdaD
LISTRYQRKRSWIEDIRQKGETKNKEEGKKEKDQKMEGKRNPILLFLPLR